jgi:hypothetical protein
VRAAVLLAGLVLAAPAGASITVAYNAQHPTLRVGADGTAEVGWNVGGTQHTLLVPPHGQVLPGGHLSGADVSNPGSRRPLFVVSRRTPDGRSWGLQAWRVSPTAPLELRFSRWRGAPPVVTLSVTGSRLAGRATFQGRPVHGYAPTPEGKQVRITVYLDCLGCPAKPGWSRLLGVFPRADGSFGAFLRPAWSGARYRATLTGPNLGTTFAPDAVATT